MNTDDILIANVKIERSSMRGTLHPNQTRDFFNYYNMVVSQSFENEVPSIWITTEIFLAPSQIRTHWVRVMELMKQALYLQATTAGSQQIVTLANYLDAFVKVSNSFFSGKIRIVAREGIHSDPLCVCSAHLYPKCSVQNNLLFDLSKIRTGLGKFLWSLVQPTKHHFTGRFVILR